MHTGLSINELAPGGSDRPARPFLRRELLRPERRSARHDQRIELSRSAPATTARSRWARRTHGERWARLAGALAPDGGAAAQAARRRARHVLPEGSDDAGDSAALDLQDLKGNLLGHFDAGQIPPVGERQRVADRARGRVSEVADRREFRRPHHRLLFIEYQPGVSIGLHDHTFEEAYFILSGEVEGTMDGKTYIGKPGDVLWTGVGCVHAFANVSSEPVRWLETFAPQPPKENVFRFMAEWETTRTRSWRGDHGARHRGARGRTPAPSISRAFATAARSGSTASASRTSRRIPAFRNTARMIARLYDALHDPARKDVLTTPTDTGSGGFTHKFYKASRNAEELVGARDAIAEWARVTYGWIGRSPDYKAAFLATLGANAGFYAPYDENARRWYKKVNEEVSFVNHAIVNPPVDRDKPLDEVKDVYMHVEEETDAGLVVSGAKVVATTSTPDALQLHRQQRRAADQDQAVRLRLHGADRRAGREAALPAVLRDDGGGDGHAVRLPAVEPDGRERLDPDLRQGAGAVGERVRLRRHREGQQLLPALGVPAALHVPGLHAPGGEDGLPGRPAAQGGRGDRRQGLPRRAGAGRRSAGLAQPVLGPDRCDGADDDAVDGRLRAAESRLRSGVSRDGEPRVSEDQGDHREHAGQRADLPAVERARLQGAGAAAVSRSVRARLQRLHAPRIASS